jgi:hypothetical protein
MTNILPVAALTMMLVAFSGQAFARTAAPDTQQQPQAAYLFAVNSWDQATAPSTADVDTHRYTGGPKSND